MAENPEVVESITPSSETLAEYRFIITFENYPDGDLPEGGNLQEIMNLIDKALAKDFADEVEFLFGGLVKVRLLPLEQGSILGTVILVLATAITAADFFSKYKDFYESLVLLRSQLRSILSRVLNRSLSPKVYRTVNITFVPSPATRFAPAPHMVQTPVVPVFYSKAFLIYLLVMNIILIGIIIGLVWHAVSVVYFNTP